MPEVLMYVGTYTVRGSEGIYVYRFHQETGDLRLLGLAARSTDPTFLCADTERSLLYSVEETSNYHNQLSGAVRAYRADAETGRLSLLSEVASMGTGPCYLAFDQSGRYLLTANYHSGSISVFPRLEDGGLGRPSAVVQPARRSNPPSTRQEGPHAHAIVTSPDNRWILVADLGLDQLLLYPFDATTGTIEDKDPAFVRLKDEAGPRHVSFHPNGRFVYLVNELDSTVTHLVFDTDQGSLEIVQTLPCLPEGFTGHNDAAHLQMDAGGRFLYTSNRGHDSISVFSIDPLEGTLQIVQHAFTHGKTPRGFVIDPTGQWLLVGNENSDNMAIFRVSPETGTLTMAHEGIAVPSPVFLMFP